MLFVCTTQGCVTDDDPKGTALTVGESLPKFSVTLTDGTIVSDATLTGKIGVIVFFNTGCGDCRRELPVIQQLWEIYKDNPQIVIAPIAREESLESISTYWDQNGLTMPFSPQDNKDVYLLFAPSVIPRIFITDPRGVIRFTSDDSDMPSLDALEKVINSLL